MPLLRREAIVTMEDAVVTAMADFWPEVAAENLPPTHCILAARVAVEIGAYFGVPITARSVKAAAFNKVALDWIGKPLKDWPKEAWSVGVEGVGNHGLGYDGHVIAESEHWIIDLSVGQFARPKHQLDIPETLVVRKDDTATADRMLTVLTESGCQVTYLPYDDTAWMRAPDWYKRANWTAEVGAMIRLVKEAMRA